MAKEYVLHREQWLEQPLDRVFPFFADARNLGRITPDFVGFQILSKEPIEMRAGTLIDYRIRIAGVPMRWRTEITEFDAPDVFVDVQRRGPYAKWHHTHRFEAVDGRTRMTDEVHYRLPFGVLGRLAHALFVKRMLSKIFDYRHQVIAQEFGCGALIHN